MGGHVNGEIVKEGHFVSRVLSVVLWGRSAARVQRVHRVQKVQRVVVAADAADYKKRGAAGAADCVEGLWKKVLKMDRPYGPEGS